MRIIAGIHRSRVLKTLDGMDTRPMMDRMKESVFNIIGPYFDNQVVLDLFGGSGALSLEALSRGAKCSYICEINPKAISIIKENVTCLKENDRVFLMQGSYEIVLTRLQVKFDIVFLDPPYKLNIIPEIIDKLKILNLLNEGCLIVCQYVKGNFNYSELGCNVLKQYTYGTSEVCILEYTKK